MSQLKFMDALKRPCGEGIIPTGIGQLDELLGGGLPKRDVTVLAGPGISKSLLAEELAVSISKSGVRTIYAGLALNSKVNTTLALLNAGGRSLGLSLSQMSTLPLELLNGEWDCVTFGMLNDVLLNQINGDGSSVVLVVDSATMVESGSIIESVATFKGVAYESKATIVLTANVSYDQCWRLEDAGALAYVDDASGDKGSVTVVKAPRVFSLGGEESERGRGGY